MVIAKQVFFLPGSDIVDYSYEDLLSSVIPVYTDILLKSKLRILIFRWDFLREVNLSI